MPPLRQYLSQLFTGAPAPVATPVAAAPMAPDPPPAGLERQSGVAAKEFGVSGTENFGGVIKREDYNPDLDDWQKAVAIYDKMRRTDAMVRAVLQVIKLPLLGATWTCHPASSDPVDQQIADFVNESLYDDDAMDESWHFYLRHALLQLEFGVSLLEKVWKVDDQGRYRFKRLAPRLPKTLREFHVNREGKLLAIVQYAPVAHSRLAPVTSRSYTGSGSNKSQGLSAFSPASAGARPYLYGSSVSYQYLTIPASYCCPFVLDREGDNYEGYSLLRNIYRNFWFKDQAYHVMGVGLDRWGVGIPIAALEEGHNLTAADKEILKEILQSVRSNEKAYMVTPEHVNFRIEPSGSGQGTQSHFGISWIEHNDTQMARNILASFLTMGTDPHGTLGFGSRLTDMFISSLNGIANGINADIKQYLIKDLCDYNFDMTSRKYPIPVCLDLEQTDLSSLVDVLSRLQGTVLTSSDEDETVLRKMLGLPPLKPNLSREAKAAQPAPGAPPMAPGAMPGAAESAPMPGMPGPMPVAPVAPEMPVAPAPEMLPPGMPPTG